MDEMIKTEPFTHNGIVRAQYLLDEELGHIKMSLVYKKADIYERAEHH